MSFHHGHLWQCNYCRKEIFKHAYGLPKGWAHLFDGIGKERKHICDKCQIEERRTPEKQAVSSCETIKVGNWEPDKYWINDQIRSPNKDDNALYWAILDHDKNGAFFRIPALAKRNECGPVAPSMKQHGFICVSDKTGHLNVAPSNHADDTKRSTDLKKFKDKVRTMVNKKVGV